MPTSAEGSAATSDHERVEAPDDERPEEAEARAEARARVRRGRVVTALVLAAVVLLVTTVALLGGFDRQRTEVVDVAAGTPFVTGPFEVTLDSASVTFLTHDSLWSVRTTGTIRGTGSVSVVPSLGRDGFAFAARNVEDQGVRPSDVSLAEGQDTYPQRQAVAPGVPPVPWVMTFRFAQDPGDQVLVGIYGQAFRTKYLFDDELVWQNTRTISKIALPLTWLPDDTYTF